MKAPRIPDFIGGESVPASSYGLIESIGGERTEIDRDDDKDYYDDCQDWALECWLYVPPDRG